MKLTDQHFWHLKHLSRNCSDWNEVRQQGLNDIGSFDFFNSWPKLSDSRAPELVNNCV